MQKLTNLNMLYSCISNCFEGVKSPEVSFQAIEETMIEPTMLDLYLTALRMRNKRRNQITANRPSKEKRYAEQGSYRLQVRSHCTTAG